MISNKFKHKETRNIYVVEKVVNVYGLDIVIYTEDVFPLRNTRRYASDLYEFLENMELIKDK